MGIIPHLEEPELDHLITIEDGHIYHRTQYNAQNGIASFFTRFPRRESEEEISFDIEDIGIIEQEFHTHYEDE